MEVNPIEVQKHLKGIGYPASREEVIETAERNGAPGEILEALRAIEPSKFEGPDEVQAALN